MPTNTDTAEYNFIDRTLMGDERNRTLFDWSPMAIVIINQQGVFLDANKKLFEWLGYKPEEIIGKHLTRIPFFPEHTKQTIIQNFTQRLNGKDIPSYEVEFIHKDGASKWGEVHGVLLKDTMNQIVFDLVMVSDITERKETMKRLQVSEEKYRNLFENATDLIQSVNEQGRFVDVNPQWLHTLEYTKDEVVNLHFIDILRKDQIPHCQDIFYRVSKGETIKNVETIYLSKTGKEILVEGNISPFFKDGQFIATIGIFRDVTDKKKRVT
ncbi:MAG: PAS domain-containing protein [Methanobacteriota archaeon]